ncbi:MAG: hypothetical protein ACRDHP_20550 [Ktedonobacterales bacterium]
MSIEKMRIGCAGGEERKREWATWRSGFASELAGARAVGMATAAISVYRDGDAVADYYLDAFPGLLGVV